MRLDRVAITIREIVVSRYSFLFFRKMGVKGEPNL